MMAAEGWDPELQAKWNVADATPATRAFYDLLMANPHGNVMGVCSAGTFISPTRTRSAGVRANMSRRPASQADTGSFASFRCAEARGDSVMSLLYQIGQRPIIAALRSVDRLDGALESGADHLFFMGGSVNELVPAVRAAKEQGKGAFVHIDLVRGLSSTDKESIDFIRGFVGADGIVTPKSHLIKEAKRAGLYAILHLFALDSLALDNGRKLAQSARPDAVELMPGVIPKAIAALADALPDIPVIASGLIQTQQEAAAALNAGATSLSVSEPSLWGLSFEDLRQS